MHEVGSRIGLGKQICQLLELERQLKSGGVVEATGQDQAGWTLGQILSHALCRRLELEGEPCGGW